MAIGMDDKTKSTIPQKVKISGDGQVLWEGLIFDGVDAENLELDVSGVLKLEIFVERNTSGFGYVTIDLASPVLQ